MNLGPNALTVLRRDLAERHDRACACARCDLYRMRSFVWHEKMHLPTRLRRHLRGITIRVVAQGDGTALGRFFGRPGDGTIALYAEEILCQPDVPPGAWQSAVRRVLRHEIVHAVGASEATVHQMGDPNDLPLGPAA